MARTVTRTRWRLTLIVVATASTLSAGVPGLLAAGKALDHPPSSDPTKDPGSRTMVNSMPAPSRQTSTWVMQLHDRPYDLKRGLPGAGRVGMTSWRSTTVAQRGGDVGDHRVDTDRA